MNRQWIYLVGAVLVGILLAGYLVLGLGGMGQARAKGGSPVNLASLSDDTDLQPSPHPILNDRKMRIAVAYCTNKDALVAAAYPELDAAERALLIADTFIPKDSWAYFTPATVYAFDPDAGRQLLEDNGWTLPVGEDIRMKDGRQLALALRTTDSALRLAFMPVFEAQMRACGMRVIRSHEPWLSWLSWRDFELTEFAWGTTADELPGSSLYACDQIPGPENGWSGEKQNFMGWCNEEASLEITQASDTSLSEAERITHYQNFIDIFAEEMPSLILFWRDMDDEYDYFEHIDFNLETYLQTVEVTPEANTLLEYQHYSWTEGTLEIPAGTVAEPVTIGYYPQVDSLNPPPEGLVGFDSFRLSAFEEGLVQEAFVFSGPMTLNIEYPPVIGMQCQGCVDESTVALYVWDGDAWEKASETCPEFIFHESLDMPNNHYEVNICTHLSEYMMMAEPVYWNFLPVAAR